jgi:hypothetical protein
MAWKPAMSAPQVLKSVLVDRRRLAAIVAMAGIAALATVVLANAQGTFEVSWWSVDSGGNDMAGGAYAISGSAGQPDAGVALTGGEYGVTGGFWSALGQQPPQPTDTSTPIPGTVAPTETATTTPALSTETITPRPETAVPSNTPTPGMQDVLIYLPKAEKP